MIGTMNLSPILVHDVPDGQGSLTHCMMTLVRWAGGNATYRDVNAALGLSLRTVAVKRCPDPGWWSTYACDRFLEEAARMWGLRLRPVHPPEAAVGLNTYASFEQHFAASYAPLIRDALRHEQPVLAWQGWPDVRSAQWGIITREGDDGLGFGGTTIWSRGQSVPLVAPAIQLYVVEEVHLQQPTSEELFRAAVGRFRAVVREPGDVDPDVVWGHAAYQTWLERLEEAGPRAADAEGRGHVQHARSITGDRAAGLSFFRHYRDGAEGELRHCIDAILAECRGEIDVLATMRDPRDVAVLIGTPEGRRALGSGLRAAQFFERELADAVDTVARHVL